MKEYQKAQIHEIVTVTPRISEICRWESMILRKVTSLELIYEGVLISPLARPTSRCHRTESIVSLERGVCSSAELQVFFCYRG